MSVKPPLVNLTISLRRRRSLALTLSHFLTLFSFFSLSHLHLLRKPSFPFPTSFSLSYFFRHIFSRKWLFNKSGRWLNSNLGHLASEAAALSLVSKYFVFLFAHLSLNKEETFSDFLFLCKSILCLPRNWSQISSSNFRKCLFSFRFFHSFYSTI